jgi:hypothetical protein
MASSELASTSPFSAIQTGHSYEGQHICGNAKVHFGDVIHYGRLQLECAVKGMNQANSTSPTAPSQPLPGPSSTVPFRRDPDFVDRDILPEIHRKCSQPASRVALVGLGGVG